MLIPALVLVATACGTDDLGEPPNSTEVGGEGPRVASERFDGEFTVAAVSVGGQEVVLRTTATVSIETEFGGLTVTPACNTYLGSFTLAEAGQGETNPAESGPASFTVAGGSSNDCGDLNDQERAILDALAAVDTWFEADDGFRFDGPDGTSLTIQR